MADIVMPRLSDSMEEGTILKWLKSDGETISRGDELAEIETDKATMTYEAEEEGTLRIVASEGDTLAIGEVIARVGAGGGNGADPAAAEDSGEAEADDSGAPKSGRAAEADAAPAEANGSADAETSQEPARAATSGGGAKASPVARRMARKLGIELSDVAGSGPGGRITKADIAATAGAESGATATATVETPAPAPAPSGTLTETGTAKGDVEVVDLNRTQQLIARRMAESKATVPEFVISLDADVTALVAGRAQLKAAAREGDPFPSFNDMVLKAVALSLREFPLANGSYRDGKWELYSRVNVGMAVAGEKTLVVPTIFDTDRKTLTEIGRDSRALAGKVRDGTISPPELSGGTFTVSNLGMYGVAWMQPVINPPQAGILGVGAMQELAAPVGDGFEARRRVSLTLVCDHRILYGAYAAEFLAAVRDRLQSPLGLAL